MSGNATLQFTIVSGQWKSLTSGQIMTTPANFTVAVASSNGGANVTVSNNSEITVTGGLNNLSIEIAGSYNPMALIFKQLVSGGNSDPTGSTAFGAYARGLQGNNPTLTVKDDGESGSSYEFYVLVQDPSGDFGLIDPKISNA